MKTRVSYISNVVAGEGRTLGHYLCLDHVDVELDEIDIFDLPVAVTWKNQDGADADTRWHDGSHWMFAGSSAPHRRIRAHSQEGVDWLAGMAIPAIHHAEAFPGPGCATPRHKLRQQFGEFHHDDTDVTRSAAMQWASASIAHCEGFLIARCIEPHLALSRGVHTPGSPPSLGIHPPTLRPPHATHLVSFRFPASDIEGVAEMHASIMDRINERQRRAGGNVVPAPIHGSPFNVEIPDSLIHPWHLTDARNLITTLMPMIRERLPQMSIADVRRYVELARTMESGIADDSETRHAYDILASLRSTLGAKATFVIEGFARLDIARFGPSETEGATRSIGRSPA